MNVDWSPFGLLSRGGKHGKLNIFIFHRVTPEPDPLFPGEVHRASFERILRFLKGWCNVLPLPEAIHRLRDGTLPRAAACITFDDGYADNLTVAQPLLSRYGLPATVFVATGYLDGGRMWNDTIIEAVRSSKVSVLDLRDEDMPEFSVSDIEARRRSIAELLSLLKYRPHRERTRLADWVATRAGGPLPNDLILTTAQLTELSRRGVHIGAHTVLHPILSVINIDEAKREIEDSKRFLEGIIQDEVELFAYPNGRPFKDFGPEHAHLARQAGFVAALTTAAGVATRHSDLHQLPRFTPWARSQPRFAMQLALNLIQDRARDSTHQAEYA